MPLRARTGDEPFVLLLSDRPTERSALASAIDRVIACRLAGLDEPLPAGTARLVILHLDPAGLAAACANLDQGGWRGVPRLVLVHNGSRPVRLPAGSRVLPARTPREGVLAAAFAMIEAAGQAAGLQATRFHAQGAAATNMVADLFGNAASGTRIDTDAVAESTEIVLNAVSEVGIRAWLDIIWRHEASVYQHTLSVAGYAAAFGAVLGLRDTDQKLLARAALLHDIGKSRIPAEILNKPSRLSPEEWRLMCLHPVIGADLLEAQGDVEPAVIDVVRHHHERIDGKGYPDRLTGPAISDLTRLTAVCDVFSALTERRPYRQPMAARDALALMESETGHLDPALLRAFLAVVDQVSA